mmetsp:Transcript_34725/g.53305  ORF Transcript_34725/g.53305 Transcript_34725/m.53305 type:complete len:85 (-) Transcript_34725:2490-2744(-)
MFYPQNSSQGDQQDEGNQALTDLVQLLDSQLAETDLQKIGGMPSVKRGDPGLNLVSSDIHDVLEDQERREIVKKFESSPMAAHH